METAELVLHLPTTEWERLQGLARSLGVAPESLAEQVVRAALRGLPNAANPTAHGALSGLIGSVEAPPDLSAREGFGT